MSYTKEIREVKDEALPINADPCSYLANELVKFYNENREKGFLPDRYPEVAIPEMEPNGSEMIFNSELIKQEDSLFEKYQYAFHLTSYGNELESFKYNCHVYVRKDVDFSSIAFVMARNGETQAMATRDTMLQLNVAHHHVILSLMYPSHKRYHWEYRIIDVFPLESVKDNTAIISSQEYKRLVERCEELYNETKDINEIIKSMTQAISYDTVRSDSLSPLFAAGFGHRDENLRDRLKEAVYTYKLFANTLQRALDALYPVTGTITEE